MQVIPYLTQQWGLDDEWTEVDNSGDLTAAHGPTVKTHLFSVQHFTILQKNYFASFLFTSKKSIQLI